MDITEITMDPDLALRKLRSYQQQNQKRLHEGVHREYEAAIAAYTALSQNWTIVSLTAAMRQGGIDQHGRPRLAIARADRKQVRLEWGWSEIAFFDTRAIDAQSATLRLKVDMGVYARQSIRAHAIVPMIPADVREQIGPCDDSQRFILFEANWTPAPPEDPMLLRRLGDTDFFAVEAVWNLTPVEQAIIALTRGE